MRIEGRDYVTTKQAADELSITTRGVSQLCRRGLIEHMKIGRSIIILKTEITRYKKEDEAQEDLRKRPSYHASWKITHINLFISQK